MIHNISRFIIVFYTIFIFRERGISVSKNINIPFQRKKIHAPTNNAINEYLKELSNLLCCGKKQKQKILFGFQNRLAEFECEHPTITLTYEQIIEQFGSPKEVADSFLSECNPARLHKLIKHNRIKRFFIVTTCALVFVVLLLYSILKIHQFHWFQDGYIVQVTYLGTDPHLDELDVTILQTY